MTTSNIREEIFSDQWFMATQGRNDVRRKIISQEFSKAVHDTILGILPEEKEMIVDSVNFPSGKITTAGEKEMWNACRTQLLENLKKWERSGGEMEK